jgi:hypothetical protein
LSQKETEARQKRISQMMATAIDEEEYEKIDEVEEDDPDFQLGIE